MFTEYAVKYVTSLKIPGESELLFMLLKPKSKSCVRMFSPKIWMMIVVFIKNSSPEKQV